MNQETFNQFVQTQIPIAWIAGVRFESYDGDTMQTFVRHDFLNQNPFGSMFWAVEGMAAEFAGGFMLKDKIRSLGKDFSTLVVRSEADFTKKAVGKIIFTCDQGKLIEEEIRKAADTGEPSVFRLSSIGTDEHGDEVVRFMFTWSIKMRG